MKKRGVSPLIASVLLIAFVILIFILITTWVRRSAIEPSMGIAEEKLATTLDCISTEIDIVSVCKTSNKIQIKVDNVGDSELEGLNIRIIGDKVQLEAPNEAVPPFGRFQDDISLESGMGTITGVEVYPRVGSGVCKGEMDSSSVSDC